MIFNRMENNFLVIGHRPDDGLLETSKDLPKDPIKVPKNAN